MGNVVVEATGASLVLTGRVGIDPYGAHTNLLLQSETFATTWTASNVTVTENQAVAPSGLTTADKVDDASAVATGNINQAVTVADDSVTRYFSVFLKKTSATTNHVRLTIIYTGGTVATGGAVVDPDAGTITATTGTVASSRIENFNTDYWRVHVGVANNSLGNTAATCYVQPAYNADGTATESAAATGFAHVWGAMLSTVRDAPYVATTTAAVTVNADVITAAGAGVINATEGGLWVEAVNPVTTADVSFFQVDDGTANERVSLARDSANGRLQIRDGGAVQADYANGTFGSIGKIAARYRLNDSSVSVSGSAAVADTSCTMPTTTTFSLGRSAAEPNTTIRRVAYSTTGPTDAGLALSTAP